MVVLTPMRSIWENIVRWLSEAEDDPGDRPEVKARLKRAHATMAAKGATVKSGDQDRRDRMARVAADPHASRVMSQPPEDWEDELPGQSRVKGSPEVEPEDLPRPDQPAPGTASGIGAGRIAAKNAEPTSVSLGARARQVDPGVSGIKQRFGVNPDAYFADAPVKVDPETGRQFPLRGRPAKDQPDKDQLQLKQEPFAARHAAAVAKNTAPRDPKAKPTAYSAGAFAAGGGAHLPKGGSIRQTGKAPNVGASKAGASKLTATGDVRAPDFANQSFSPAGFTAPTEDEWAEAENLPPEERSKALAVLARRLGGKGGKKFSYGMQNIGQRGRMGVPASPGRGPGVVANPATGEWETPEQQAQTLQRPDIRAALAAKLALRGADISNKRFGAERRPHAGRADISGLGKAVDKSANAQKANARADAIASKPLGVNIRRDPEAEPKHQYKKEPEPQQGQSGGSSSSADVGPIDRNRMKQAIAARLAQMAAQKAGQKK